LRGSGNKTGPQLEVEVLKEIQEKNISRNSFADTQVKEIISKRDSKRD